MADETAAAAAAPPRRARMGTLIIVLVVTVVEAGAFFGISKWFGGAPAATYGADGEHVLEAPAPEPAVIPAEVSLLKGFKVPNHKAGFTVVYDFDISVCVPEARKTEIEELAKNREGEIRDRVAQIIRQARPAVLEEDDLSTLRALLRRALAEVVGEDELIQRVLIPRCLPIRTD